ncbi:MAG: lipoyl(octanoyl) transferase [Planctomycetota bacterium]|nr:MAG: lipoyl(octanoyl) transferase [Planctomycetota bacterium]
MSETLKVHELGQIDYQLAYEYQLQMRSEIKENISSPFHIIFCEHEKVLTLGRNFKESSMPYDESYYIDKGIQIIKVDRGGDITYHGPGQLTVYYIFDLNKLSIGRDVHKFIRALEEIVLKTLEHFEIKGSRKNDMTGVWFGDKKICALGLGFKHWISYHGIGFNVTANLEDYKDIIPCGLKGKEVGNLNDLVSSEVDLKMVKEILINNTINIFGLKEFKTEEFKKAKA